MKIPTFRKTLAGIAASLPLIAQTGSAQVLFSDNFNGMTGSSGYPATATTGANYELGNPGRIGGTLTLPSGANYVLGNTVDGSGNVNVQLGNPNTLPANNLDNNVVGDDMLLAANAATWINYDFSSINGPLTLSFDGLVDSSDPTDWFSVMLGNTGQHSFVTDTTFGILFRENGGTQYFPGGITGASGAAPGTNVWQSYQLVISDTAGTGSAFDGNGSKIEYYANGVDLGTASIAQLTAGQGYLGFGCPNSIVGIDDISVSTVPEPATMALAGLGGLALLGFRRRV
jgi:hypothetical protein